MKTTDLIPLILYQLVDGDKYGYEIVKQIEDRTNGAIVIKQPTLYSVLKKLEQGKFISSYWQDSEIGGKRHYYKLTDNGRAQLDTYPSFEQLIVDINQEDDVKLPKISPTATSENKNDMAVVSTLFKETEPLIEVNTELSDEIKPTPIDLTASVQPISLNPISETNITTEPQTEFSLSLDDMTESEEQDIVANIVEAVDTNDSVIESPTRINIFDAIEPAGGNDEPKLELPTYPVQPKIELEVESPIQNETVVEPVVNNKLYGKLTPNEELGNILQSPSLEEAYSPIQQIEQIKYLNYVDLNTDLMSIKRKKAIAKHIQKMALTCISLLIMFVASIILVNKYSFGKLYYISATAACVVMVVYPILLLKSIPKIRLKYCSTPFKYSFSRDFFIKLSLFLSLIIAIFAYNLTIASDIKIIFELSNFGNFFAPIMFSLVIILDFVYGLVLYKDYK